MVLQHTHLEFHYTYQLFLICGGLNRYIKKPLGDQKDGSPDCFLFSFLQCCGSGLDPDSMGSLDPYPDPEGTKWKQKNRKQFINFIFWSAWCSLLRADGFSYSLDVLYGGLGTGFTWKAGFGSVTGSEFIESRSATLVSSDDCKYQ